MMLSTGRLATGVLGLTVAGLLASCSGGTGATADNPGGAVISGMRQDNRFHGAEPRPPYQMPDVTLTADNGEPFNLVTDTAYPVTLMFFGYTNCPDVCPFVMSELARAYLELPPSVRARTQVLFVTTDPARDTPARLRSYTARFNPAFLGLTGRLATIKRVAGDLGVAITRKMRLPGGGYDVGHGAQVIGFQGNAAPVIWTEGTSVPDMVSDIRTLAGR